MKIKFFAKSYGVTSGEKPIEKVEVEKETKKSVWVEGYRIAKESQYGKYFDDYESAVEHCLDCRIKKVELAKSRFEYESQEYEKLKKILNK